MRKPKITSKRVLGAVLATALAVAGTVALANTSQAASTPSASLTPATGDAAGGTVVSIKGKGFADSTGSVVAGSVRFSTAACTTDGTSGTAAASYNVVSATKIVATTPALTAGTWYLCVWDGATATDTILGQGKFVTDTAPTATTIAPATANVAKASVLGGTTVAVTGTDFTKKSTTSIDGVSAKTTYVSDTKLSVVLPAHAAGTGYTIKVTTEYGSDLTTDTVSYVSVISVSPTYGDGTSGNVVTVTGTGFSGYTFGTAATDKVVVFIPAGTTLTAGTTTIASLNPCTSLQVESDTSLTCKAPTLSGAYSVVIVARHATTTTWASSTTQVSRSATYTAAAF
jgi:hypothetical protein